MCGIFWIPLTKKSWLGPCTENIRKTVTENNIDCYQCKLECVATGYNVKSGMELYIPAHFFPFQSSFNNVIEDCIQYE